MLLIPKKKFPEIVDNDNFIRWQEDYISTYGFYSLEPVWATEITPEYFLINRKHYGGFFKVPYKYTSAGLPDKRYLLFGWKSYPKKKDMILAIYKYYLRKFVKNYLKHLYAKYRYH